MVRLSAASLLAFAISTLASPVGVHGALQSRQNENQTLQELEGQAKVAKENLLNSFTQEQKDAISKARETCKQSFDAVDETFSEEQKKLAQARDDIEKQYRALAQKKEARSLPSATSNNVLFARQEKLEDVTDEQINTYVTLDKNLKKIQLDLFAAHNASLTEEQRTALTANFQNFTTFTALVQEDWRTKMRQQRAGWSEESENLWKVTQNFIKRTKGEKVEENKEGENKEGENKEGENKEGENKEGENKEGENKEGENKEGENKEGENKEGENKARAVLPIDHVSH